MQAVQERVCDQAILKLLRVMLRAGVMEHGLVRREVTGSPQGGVISPLLCNVYLHRLDRVWATREHGVLVRYADDVLVMCKSREQAEAALQRLRHLLAELGLQPKEAKTRIVHLQVAGEGVDFLGFHHRLVRSRPRDRRRPFTFLARWPTNKAMQHARDRIRELTARRRLLLPVEAIVQDINAFLRGWTGYFKYGHSAERFSKIRMYVRMRLALWLSKRHRRSRHFGRWALLNLTPNEFGLIRLYGIVVQPRAGKPWRDKPNAGGERRR
jgi:group II intron reverse transcriptase/maturase